MQGDNAARRLRLIRYLFAWGFIGFGRHDHVLRAAVMIMR